MNQRPRVSVAICTWNRGRLLGTTLDRLARAASPPEGSWEVLVVNNACTDDTSAVVRSFTDRLPLRETNEPRPGLSHARNRALAETTGSHIAFIDDDVLVEDAWLITLAELAQRYPEATVFAGPVRAYFPVAPDPVLLEAFPYLRKGFCQLDPEQSEGPLPDGLLPVGANMAFRKAALDGLRFNTSLGMRQDKSEGHEDLEFVRRLLARGALGIWSPRLRVQHYVDPSRMSVPYLVRFERDRARTRVRVAERFTGPRLFRVPLRVLAGYVVAHAVYGFWRLTSLRPPTLVWLAKSQRFAGKVQEYRHESPKAFSDPGWRP